MSIYDLKLFQIHGKSFVVIQIQEFKELPIICKKNYRDILEQGRIYTRTFRKPESSPSLTSSEIREIIDLAIQKQYQKLASILTGAGIDLSESDNSRILHEKEREDF